MRRIGVFIFLLTFLGINVGQLLILKCDDGWVNIYNRCYLIVPYTHTWERAKSYCSKHGAELAEPKGYDINSLLHDEANAAGISKYWIGYNRVGHETDDAHLGYWSDGRQTGVEVGIWAPSQPDVTNGSCVYVNEPAPGTTKPLWYMVHCDTVLPLVCERTPCPQDTFTCSNGGCVGFSTLCNSANDCGDFSDEQHCPLLCNKVSTSENGTISITSSSSSNSSSSNIISMKYMANMNCLYTIRVPIGARIQLQFTSFDLEEGVDMLEIWDGGPSLTSSTLAARLTGSDITGQLTYISSTNTIILRLLTDRTVEKDGFILQWTTAFTCELRQIRGVTIGTDAPGYVRVLTARQDISICSSECERSATCWGFRYEINQSGDRKQCHMITTPVVLVTSSCCNVYVKTCPWTARITSLDHLPLSATNLEASSVTAVLTTPLYPFRYPGSMDLSYTISATGNKLITLEIPLIDLCCGDAIYIYDGPGPSSDLLMTLNHLTSPGYVISTGNQVHVRMGLHKPWACEGVLVKYRAGCDLDLVTDSGLVESPGYSGGVYPALARCTWTIQPQSGNSVRLSFHTFDTEANRDFLQIYKGTSDQGEQLHPQDGFHGNTIPPTITSSKGLYIRFTTSALNNLAGFQASYSAGCPVLTSAAVSLVPSSPSYHAPDTVIMTCTMGYYFKGEYSEKTNVSLECQSDGSWNVSTLPVCERSYCGQPAILLNGYIVSATGAQGGDTVTYSCDDGFSLHGAQDALCLSTGQWSAQPSCTSEKCSNLTLVYGSDHVTIHHGDGINHGSVATVTCPQYQQLIGPETLRCNNGTWRSQPPTCEPILCPVPVIHHATLTFDQPLIVNATVTIQCLHGYAMGGAMATRGHFLCGVETEPVCENVDECSQSPAVCEGAVCEDTEGAFICTCLPGYIPVGNSGSRCQDVNECQTDNGLCDHNCTNTPGSYVCSCNYGYELYTSAMSDDLELGPGEDGSQPWHTFHVGHSCVLKRCDTSAISGITNGKALTSRTLFFYGDRINYLCDIGFTTGNTSALSTQTVTCEADGQWNRSPVCTVAFCNETQGANVMPKGPIKYKDRYTLNCTRRNGEVLVLHRECGYDGTTGMYVTRGDNLICPETDCGPVPKVAGMRDFITSCTTYNCTVVFECRQQYRRIGSSREGHYLVRCNKDGAWDFGTMRCEGGQCPDPGYPQGGETIFSMWDHGSQRGITVEEGSVVNFTCLTPGYQPEPIQSMTCRAQGDSMMWDGQLPACVDKQQPTFSNCPANMVIEAYSPVVYVEPAVSDNTAVKKLDKYPENFFSGSVLASTTSITYIATDFSDNVGTCRFRVIVKDVTPPTIDCTLPPRVVATPQGVTVFTSSFVSQDDYEAVLGYFPQSVLADFSAVGTNPILSFTATDGSNNIASCSSQLRIEAPPCTPEVLHVYNGKINCSGSQSTGYMCTVTCDQSFVFFEDQTLTQVVLTCSPAIGNWSRTLPVCTDTDLSHFEMTPQFEYSLASPGVISCEGIYEEQLQEKLLSLTSTLTSLCKTDVDNPIDISPVNDYEVSVTLISSGSRITAQMSLKFTPQGLDDYIYQTCASRIINALNDDTTAVASIRTLSGNINCPWASLVSQPTMAPSTGFYCDSAAMAVQENTRRHNCLVCPPGTFSQDQQCAPCPAGTYNDDFYKRTCKACPSDTNSQGTGLMYRKQCYDNCGMYLQSSTGKPPCVDCPYNTYWVNRTYCAPCPSNTFTKRRGAREASECVERCQQGSFSHDGLRPCTICPRHFYNPSVGSSQCVECETYQVTLEANSTSVLDCIDGGPVLCNPNPCRNSGTCKVVRHEVMCSCAPGFTGQYCESPVGPCDLNPCQNGGQCRALSLTEYNCTCTAGYSGQTCETDRNDCVDASCTNNGTCIDLRQRYTCACPSYSGYIGDMCQFTQDPCLVNPCQNNGQCLPQGSYFRVCNCADGFTGLNCEIDIDECLSFPCINGGTCADVPNGFRCQCPLGYQGDYCHQRTSSGICTTSSCSQGISCIDNYVTNTHYCTCPVGLDFDGSTKNCAAIQQSCDQGSCGDNGECWSYDGGFHTKCDCEIGYGGTACAYDVNFCLYSPCQNHGICTDLTETYSCFCALNGTGGETCMDSYDGCQECVSDNTASCVDTLTSYTCYCKPGYTGVNCQTAISPCESLPCQHGGSCVSNSTYVTGYVCACPSAWTGTNCEMAVDNCDSSTNRCQNGATCQSTSEGFICLCVRGYIGPLCAEEYDACERTQPCVGNSTCTSSPAGLQCQCEPGYTGKGCQTHLYACTGTSCKNGGTCIEQISGTFCRCLPGFQGSDCSISACSLVSCPNGQCVIVEGVGKCVCNSGKIGENCQKDISQDFDYLVTPVNLCGDDVPVLRFSLGGTGAISMVTWIRHTRLEQATPIVTVYGADNSNAIVTDNWWYKITLDSRGVTFQLVTVSTIILELLPFNEKIVADGLWHHVAVTWSNVNGYLTLYADGEFNDEMFVAQRQQLVGNGYLLMGSVDGQEPGFHGRLSRVQVYGRKLTDSDVETLYQDRISQVTGGLLDQEADALAQFSVDFTSQLTTRICTSLSNCPDRAFNASAMPTVVSCPEDKGVVSARVAMLTWDTARFKNTDPHSHVSSATSAGTELGWGIFGIGSAEYDAKNNAAVCVFRLYNKRAGCLTLVHTDNTRHTCEAITGGSRCTVDCININEVPTVEPPTFYTCSHYGMWDQATRLTPFMYPQCAPATDPRYNVTMTFHYTRNLTCQNILGNLTSFLTNQLVSLNQQSQQELCRYDNGNKDLGCTGVKPKVDCISGTEAAVRIVFPFLSSEVYPETALKVALADNKLFNVDSLVPDIQSLNIDAIPYCLTGSRLVKDKCVQCGGGYQYNPRTGSCDPCAMGSYRAVNATSDPLSSCISCPGSETTQESGAFTSLFCHESCYLGNYLDGVTFSCMPCPVGFYGDRVGMTYCSACNINSTTHSEGTLSSTMCVDYSMLSTTETPQPDPAIGASTSESGLSGGIIAAIVISSVIFILLVIILILICTKRLPCISAGTIQPAGSTPWKHVNKYGEMNMKYVNYRLSDLRDFKDRTQDKMPIYQEPLAPEDSVSLRTELSVHVPIFTEKLNGTVHKKHTLISTGRASEVGSEHTLERTIGSEHAPSDTAHTSSTAPLAHNQVNGEHHLAPSPQPQRRHHRHRKGRRPADLNNVRIVPPRTLSPLEYTLRAPELPESEEYIAPLPSMTYQRRAVPRTQYQEFLERPSPPTITPLPKQGSSKIVLDSDDEDYR